MTGILITAIVLITLAAAGAVFVTVKVYSASIAVLTADNIDLRNRLFIAKGQPPTGVDVTAKYIDQQEEKQQNAIARRETAKKPAGPLARLRDNWKEKDLKARSKGLDVTIISKQNN